MDSWDDFLLFHITLCYFALFYNILRYITLFKLYSSFFKGSHNATKVYFKGLFYGANLRGYEAI